MKLTNEEIQLKADELTKQYGANVTPIVFVGEATDEQIIGYLKEPNRLVKLRVLDKAMTSAITAAGELLEVVILKEHSDPRIMSEAPENDKYNLGATMSAMNLIKYSSDTFKKK